MPCMAYEWHKTCAQKTGKDTNKAGCEKTLLVD